MDQSPGIFRGSKYKMKKGQLESVKNQHKVTDRSQAIAIGLFEARKKGARVPKKS